MAEARDALLFMAHVAEQSDRFGDMVDIMLELCQKDEDLTNEERNMLNVAYKNKIGSARTALRVLSAHETRHKEAASNKTFTEYKRKLFGEVRSTCDSVLELVEKTLLARSQDNTDSTVFYLKMCGDYYRYAVEFAKFATGDEHDDLKHAALGKYDEAWEKAQGLSPDDPLRLGLALNFSVFHYEVMEKHDKACELARKALGDAISEVSGKKKSLVRDSELILQLLRENLSLWSGNEEEEEGDVENDEK